MMDAATAYFLKKYYPHVIKWWLVVYNPEFFRIWPSEAEKDEALKIEAEEEAQLALEMKSEQDAVCEIDESAFNETTGSYSGLYGQKPVDENTQAALDAIMSNSSNQNSVDFLLSGGEPKTGAAYAVSGSDASNSGDVVLPPEHEDVVKEANAIYERLLFEAAEDEARKQAEIETARQQAAG